MTELGLLKKILYYQICVLLEPLLGCFELCIPFLDESLIFLDGKHSLLSVLEESLRESLLDSCDDLFLGNWLWNGFLVWSWSWLAQGLKICFLNLSLKGETALLGNCAGLVIFIKHGLGWRTPERGLSLLRCAVPEVLKPLLSVL